MSDVTVKFSTEAVIDAAHQVLAECGQGHSGHGAPSLGAVAALRAALQHLLIERAGGQMESVTTERAPYMSAPRIPYGKERRANFTPPEPNPTCHDCGVRPGELHKDGCDVEECETCGKQRIGCSCCVVCRAHENDGTWCVCENCIERARVSRGAPTPAMIDAAQVVAQAAETYVRAPIQSPERRAAHEALVRALVPWRAALTAQTDQP